MAFNGSGVFQRLYSWVTDRDAGTKINAPRMDAETDGIVAGLNSVVDGTQGFIGPVRGSNGTVSLPGHSFTDDPDTGMYRSAANELSLSVGGAQELVISTGFVDAVNGFKIGGTEITATAAQLNELGAFANALALPSSDGTNGQVLSTDGAGNLAFSTPASGVVGTSGTPVVSDFARFTDANTIEGRSYAEVRSDLSLEVGIDVQAYDADTLKADTHDTLTAGFDSDVDALGTVSSGITTPEVDADTKENFKTLTNGGAFTLAPPSTSSNCTILLQVTNSASAGTITTSSFTIVNGDDYDTTNGNDFLFHIKKVGAFSSLTIEALQ